MVALSSCNDAFLDKYPVTDMIEDNSSTVIREIRRNSKPDGTYVWKYAQSKCEARKHGFKGNHRKPEDLWWRVDRMIEDEDWSPS